MSIHDSCLLMSIVFNTQIYNAYTYTQCFVHNTKYNASCILLGAIIKGTSDKWLVFSHKQPHL